MDADPETTDTVTIRATSAPGLREPHGEVRCSGSGHRCGGGRDAQTRVVPSPFCLHLLSQSSLIRQHRMAYSRGYQQQSPSPWASGAPPYLQQQQMQQHHPVMPQHQLQGYGPPDFSAPGPYGQPGPAGNYSSHMSYGRAPYVPMARTGSFGGAPAMQQQRQPVQSGNRTNFGTGVANKRLGVGFDSPSAVKRNRPANGNNPSASSNNNRNMGGNRANNVPNQAKTLNMNNRNVQANGTNQQNNSNNNKNRNQQNKAQNQQNKQQNQQNKQQNQQNKQKVCRKTSDPHGN